jgi:hypothetical protein
MSLVAANLGAAKKQQQLQLVEEHSRIWACLSSSSSSPDDGRTAEHSSLQQQQQQQRDHVHVPSGAPTATAAAPVQRSSESDPATIHQMLDAAEAGASSSCAVVLMQSLSLINSPTLVASTITAWQIHAQQLLLLLGNPAKPDSLWLQHYEKCRAAEATAIADAVKCCGDVLADTAMSLNAVVRAVGEVSQKTEAERWLCSKLYERVASADGEFWGVSPQQQQQQQMQREAHTQLGTSSAASAAGSSSSSACAGEGAVVGSAAATCCHSAADAEACCEQR